MKTNEDTYKTIVRGRVATGCKAVKAHCATCNLAVIAHMKNGAFFCSSCGTLVRASQGAKIFMQSLDHFVLPNEISAVTGESPKSLRIIPAYPSVDRTLTMGYAKWISSKRRPVCYGNGSTAKRFDFQKGQYINISCKEGCLDRMNKTCRFEATFYFYIPDIDVMAIFEIRTHSVQSAQNIRNILLKLKALNIRNKVICELKIIERSRVSDNSIYRVLELTPPSISIRQVERLTGK